MRIAALCLVIVAAAVAAQGGAGPPPPVLVTFEQAGGFAGIERGLAVHRSGRVVADGLALTTRRLAPARLRALRTALVQARFATLARRYEAEITVSDGYVYRIAYGGRAVRIDEDAVLPARLRRVFTLLNGLIRD